MVKKEDLIEIGYTKKIHGLKGELKASVTDRYLEDFVSSKMLFLQVNSSFIPYAIDNIRMGNEIILKLDEVDDVNAARLIQSKKILIKLKDIIPPEKRKIKIKDEEYLDIEGYKMKSVNQDLIGTIIEVVSTPSQKMAVVKTEFEEKLIPLNPHFVKEINRTSKVLIVDLPEGMLDL